MTTVALYQPGTSVLHRIPAGPKLLGMLAAIVAVVSLQRPWELGCAAAVTAVLFGVARIAPRVIWRQLRPLRWVVVFVATAQIILTNWQTAVLVCGTLVVSVALATLLTLTTTVTAMLDVCKRILRPFERFGVDADRVGLVLALTIRCIPLMATIVEEVMQARKARGLGFSLHALAAPVVIRALRTADAIGDALIARGLDD